MTGLLTDMTDMTESLNTLYTLNDRDAYLYTACLKPQSDISLVIQKHLQGQSMNQIANETNFKRQTTLCNNRLEKETTGIGYR